MALEGRQALSWEDQAVRRRTGNLPDGRPNFVFVPCGTPRQPIRLDQVHRAVGRGGVEPSVGGVGTVMTVLSPRRSNGLYNAEIIHRRGPWHH
jgi:hypothetical protein